MHIFIYKYWRLQLTVETLMFLKASSVSVLAYFVEMGDLFQEN